MLSRPFIGEGSILVLSVERPIRRTGSDYRPSIGLSTSNPLEKKKIPAYDGPPRSPLVCGRRSHGGLLMRRQVTQIIPLLHYRPGSV